jgi:small conductance mechanosensitive channel
MELRFVLFGITILLAIGIGLTLRHFLVRRLKSTILDNWIIQLLGVIVFIPVLIVATIVALFILDIGIVFGIWDTTKKFVSQQPTLGLAYGLIETILVILLGLGIARTIMKLTIRGIGSHIDINIRTLVGRLLFILIILIGFFSLLSIWHVGIDLPVALIGTLTVALTFAIQDILKDLVAGFYILMERPFHIGDLITISNTANAPLHTGIVEDIQLRATIMRITSGEQVIVPNSLVFGGVVINDTYYSERRVTLTLTLPAEEFIKDKTPEHIIKSLVEIKSIVTKEEPSVLVSGYIGTSLKLTVRFWIANEQLASISEVMYTLHTAFPHADMALIESAGAI